MSKAEFLVHLDEIMEQEPGTLKGDERLEGLPKWDSMTVVQFIAMVDEEFDFSVGSTKLMACSTVDDLAGLLGNRITS